MPGRRRDGSRIPRIAEIVGYSPWAASTSVDWEVTRKVKPAETVLLEAIPDPPRECHSITTTVGDEGIILIRLTRGERRIRRAVRALAIASERVVGVTHQ